MLSVLIKIFSADSISDVEVLWPKDGKPVADGFTIYRGSVLCGKEGVAGFVGDQ
jgi:hypothetical protein